MIQLTDWLRTDALAFYLFHGIVPEPTAGLRNYTGKHLDAGAFRDLCVSLLTAGGTPIGADDALAALRGEKRLPPRAFLISFDDGFRNNHTVARPILEELEVSAIVYATTRFVNENGVSWIDEIEDAIERTTLREFHLSWEDARRPCDSRPERIALLDEVRRRVKTGSDLDPYDVATEICDQAGTGSFRPNPLLDTKLSWDELQDVDDHPLMTVGGHSHTHRILSHLAPEELEQEVSTSTALLRRHLGRRVHHHSYPEGLQHCYSDRVIGVLRRHGGECCATAEPGVNRVGDDPFRLRRVLVA